MKIFISHINQESSLALILKEWIESSFAGQCDVFVSSDKDFVNTLLSSLAKHPKISKIPRIDQQVMRRELLAALPSAKEKPTTVEKQNPEIIDEVVGEALEILKAFGKLSDKQQPTASELSNHFRFTEQRMQYYLDSLEERKLIHRFWYMGSPLTYILSKEGRTFLFDRSLL